MDVQNIMLLSGLCGVLAGAVFLWAVVNYI